MSHVLFSKLTNVKRYVNISCHFPKNDKPLFLVSSAVLTLKRITNSNETYQSREYKGMKTRFSPVDMYLCETRS